MQYEKTPYSTNRLWLLKSELPSDRDDKAAILKTLSAMSCWGGADKEDANNISFELPLEISHDSIVTLLVRMNCHLTDKACRLRMVFENALATIGWSVRKSGNGLNDFVINHKGEETAFVVHGEELQIRHSLFGSSFCGTVHINLSSIVIRTEKTNDVNYSEVTLWLGKNFISFYHHDTQQNEN